MSDKIEEVILNHPSFTESRLTSLYSNFNHLKETNPDGYEANLQAWSSLVPKLIDSGLFEDQCAVDSNSVVDMLSITSKNLKPRGLNKVFDRLTSDRLLVPNSRFATSSINDIQGKGFVKSILSLTPLFNRPYKSGSDDENGVLNKNEKFISISKLKEISSIVQDVIEKEHPPILSETHLRKLLKKEAEDDRTDGAKVKNSVSRLSEFDINCCLLYLQRDLKSIRITQKRNIQLIDPSDKEVLSDEQIDSISDLKDGCNHIEEYNYSLANRIQVIDSELKTILHDKEEKGDKKLDEVAMARAKTLISLKKRLKESLKNSHESLQNLSLVLLKITDAKNNLMTVQTLESNAQLLEALNKKVGSPEEVVELMNNVHSEVNKVNKITEQLGNSDSRHRQKEEEEEEDAALENELAQLLAEEEKIQLQDIVSHSESEKLADKDTDALDLELEARLAALKLTNTATEDNKSSAQSSESCTSAVSSRAREKASLQAS